MSSAYQDSDTNASSFFQGYIIRLEKSQVLIHQELEEYSAKVLPKTKE
jgi:hypothetical protein